MGPSEKGSDQARVVFVLWYVPVAHEGKRILVRWTWLRKCIKHHPETGQRIITYKALSKDQWRDLLKQVQEPCQKVLQLGSWSIGYTYHRLNPIEVVSTPADSQFTHDSVLIPWQRPETPPKKKTFTSPTFEFQLTIKKDSA